MNGQGYGQGYGSLTPEERAYLMQKLPNIGVMEDEALHQQALANALRTRPTQRMDTASQIARGLSGIYGGYKEATAGQGRQDIGRAYEAFARGWPGRRRPDEMVEAPYSYGDLS